MKKSAQRVMLLGATGTAGAAVLHALLQRGYDVVCFGRTKPAASDAATVRLGNVTDNASLQDHGFCGEQFDVLISCLASRSGDPKDVWAIDHRAHVNALTLAKTAGVKHMVLLSAICVQKPKLQFQFAKLAFEKQVMESGIIYSIVRPTALFKSLSGQIERLKKGKSFLVFGNGKLTACTPISDRDLADFMLRCIEDPALHNKILPIGGPHPAITPLQQAERLFALLDKPQRITHVPIALLDMIIAILSALGQMIPSLARKAELARIGRYYATESMLVLNPDTNRYDVNTTPATGRDTLFHFYAETIKSGETINLKEHAVF
jgi:divinyl chlorophyllide a 8-vinyl-reductase